MQIVGYNFEQPYVLRTTTFNDVAAVYVIYTVSNGQTRWLDVGEASGLGERISGHDRKDCWLRNAQGNEIYVGVSQQQDEYTRKQIESDLRNKLRPLCGDR